MWKQALGWGMALLLSLHPLLTVTAQEQQNLSPVPQLGSGAGASLVESTSSDAVIASSESNLDLPDWSIQAPQSLLDALAHEKVPTLLSLTSVEAQARGQASGQRILAARIGQFYILNQADGQHLPFTALASVTGGEIAEAWESSNEMVDFANQVMKQRGQDLKGTVVDSLVSYSQAQPDQIKDLFISFESLDQLQELFETQEAIRQFYQAVLVDWLATQPQATGQDPQQLRYDLSGETAEQFTALVQRYLSDYPRLKPLFDRLAQPYEGTILLDYNKGQVAVGLIQGNVALDYRLDSQPLQMARPQDAQILTRQAFTELLGFDWYQGLDEVTQRLAQ